MRRQILRACLVVLAAISAPLAAVQAKDFPSETIRIINPFAPGGSTDVVARIFAQFLTELWGQSVVVESRTGAGGVVGSTVTANAAPDGYTIQLASSSVAIAPSLNKSLPYETLDFTPIVYIGDAPLFLVVNPSVNVSSVQELIALARAKPGELNYGSSGNGTSIHISSELFKQMSGTDINHVPYRGIAPALNDLIAGRVQMMVVDITGLPRIQSGQLKALAVIGERRTKAMPDLPTVSEAGLTGYKINQWYGVIGPKGIPKDVVAKLNDGFNRALKDPKVVERLATFGIEPVGGPPDVFAKTLRDDVKLYDEIVKRGNLKADN